MFNTYLFWLFIFQATDCKCFISYIYIAIHNNIINMSNKIYRCVKNQFYVDKLLKWFVFDKEKAFPSSHLSPLSNICSINVGNKTYFTIF